MLSIVMPAYNEAENIEAAVREWHDEVASKIEGARIIVVNDRSSDATGAILDRVAGELASLLVIHSKVNRGHGPSVRAGLDAAGTEWVLQTDSDRQHLPSDFWKLWNARENADFVFGFRTTREDGPFRKLVTATMRVMNFSIWGVWVRDANCPFKLMRREKMNAVLGKIPRDAFIPMVHLAILARKMRMRIVEMPVAHLPRRAGAGSLSGLAKWGKIGARCVREIVSLRLNWRRA